MNTPNLVKYSSDGINLEARIEDGQAWLTYEQTAELFGRDVNTISEHAKNILDTGELSDSARRDFLLVRTEGNRAVKRGVLHLNQDMIDAIGRRVRRNRAAKAESGVVYFIEAIGIGLVKVGKTHDLAHRIAALRAISPVALKLIKSIPGYTKEESELHARWAKHRAHGEWFKLAPIRREILGMQHETSAAAAG